MTLDAATKALSDIFHIDVSPECADEAMTELAKYHDLQFETLRGKYKLNGDSYILLAIENTQMHNGAWARYIDYLKATYKTVVIQSVVNKRLLSWFLRNGFVVTKKHKDWAVWRVK